MSVFLHRTLCTDTLLSWNIFGLGHLNTVRSNCYSIQRYELCASHFVQIDYGRPTYGCDWQTVTKPCYGKRTWSSFVNGKQCTFLSCVLHSQNGTELPHASTLGYVLHVHFVDTIRYIYHTMYIFIQVIMFHYCLHYFGCN